MSMNPMITVRKRVFPAPLRCRAFLAMLSRTLVLINASDNAPQSLYTATPAGSGPRARFAACSPPSVPPSATPDQCFESRVVFG